jgi:hypothetical protein
MILKRVLYILIFLVSIAAKASFILPMDENNKNHLKAYGITFWCLEKNYKTSWLLNYRGGSFLLPDAQTYARNVKLEALALKCFQMVKKLGF